MEFFEFSKRLDPLRKILSKAKKECFPALPANTGMSVCMVRSKAFPKLSVANMVKRWPGKIEALKECIRLNLVFYAAYRHIIEPEGAEDIRDRETLDRLCEELEREVPKFQTCEQNIVKQWRFIRGKKGVKTLDFF